MKMRATGTLLRVDTSISKYNPMAIKEITVIHSVVNGAKNQNNTKSEWKFLAIEYCCPFFCGRASLK